MKNKSKEYFLSFWGTKQNTYIAFLLILPLFAFSDQQINQEISAQKVNISAIYEYTAIENKNLNRFEKNLPLSILIYNKNNKKSEYYRFHSLGKTDSKESYFYDQRGNIIKTVHINSMPVYNYEIHSVYDLSNREIKRTLIDSDNKLKTVSTYQYDPKGMLILWEQYDSKNQLESKSEFTYDEINGNLNQSSRFQGNGKQEFRWIEKYNSFGDKTEETLYNSENKIKSQEFYFYNASRKLIQWQVLEKNELSFTVYYTYINNRLIESKTILPNEQTDYIETYKYDEKGNKIEFFASFPRHKINLRETYLYDSNGKQIELKSYDKNGALEFILRDSYHPNEKISAMSKITPDGKYLYKWEYIYNQQGNVIKKNLFGKNLVPEKSWHEEYDGNGNKICSLEFDYNPQTQKTIFKYGRIYEIIYEK